MLTRGTSNDALPSLVLVEMGHFVVGASQLEGEDGLKVLSLKQHIGIQTITEIYGMG